MTAVSVMVKRNEITREEFIYYSDSPPWRVGMRIPGLGLVECEGSDLFNAFRELRKIAGAENEICCNGARVNARPSPISSAAGGNAVYLLSRLRPASLRDTVPLFGPTAAKNVVTVEQQDEWWNAVAENGVSKTYLVNPIYWWKRINEILFGPRIWFIESDAATSQWVARNGKRAPGPR